MNRYKINDSDCSCSFNKDETCFMCWCPRLRNCAMIKAGGVGKLVGNSVERVLNSLSKLYSIG